MRDKKNTTQTIFFLNERKTDILLCVYAILDGDAITWHGKA